MNNVTLPVFTYDNFLHQSNIVSGSSVIRTREIPCPRRPVELCTVLYVKQSHVYLETPPWPGQRRRKTHLASADPARTKFKGRFVTYVHLANLDRKGPGNMLPSEKTVQQSFAVPDFMSTLSFPAPFRRHIHSTMGRCWFAAPPFRTRFQFRCSVEHDKLISDPFHSNRGTGITPVRYVLSLPFSITTSI